MKSLTILFVILVIGAIGGTIFYLEGPKALPDSSKSPIESASPPPMQETQSVKEVVVEQKKPSQIPEGASVSKPASNTPSASIPSTPFSQAINALVSPQTSFMKKQEAWKQLLDAGELDQAIEALKEGAANNPTSADYPAALGEAYLQKANAIFQSGGSISEMGSLGMQADQSFDAALKADPANWDAQFFKAAAMSHWPAELNKGDEVVQRFSDLIDQQKTMTQRPEFAQTYVLLGNEFQKLGQPDKALETWQHGLAQFPGDPTLQKAIANP